MLNKKEMSGFVRLFPDCYFMLLDDKGNRPAIKIGNKFDYAKADRFNKIGYGVFFTPNGHRGGYKTEKLTRINAWYVDCDSLTKSQQLKLVASSPLPPSLIIESKRGYHLYWFAKDATVEEFKRIELEYLVPFFHGDTATQKTNQLLRVPGFYHNKKRPFLVKNTGVNIIKYYTQTQIVERFGGVVDKTEIQAPINKVEPEHFRNTCLRENPEITPRYDLLKLSGSPHVSGEEYSLELNHDGTKQIIVNGKRSSCWIRLDGSIGSHSGGGPTVYQWLAWYKRYTHQEILDILRETY